MWGECVMSDDNKHINQQSKNSASPTATKNDEENSFFHDCFLALGKIIVILGIIIFLYVIFSMLIKLFSSVICITLTVIGVLPSICIVAIKRLSKELWGKISNSSLKPIFNMFEAINKIIKYHCNKNKLLKDISIALIFIFAFSFVISLLPGARIKALEFVDNVNDHVKNTVYVIIGKDVMNGESVDTDLERENQGVNDTQYPYDMTFIIEKRDCSEYITRELVEETYFYHEDTPLLYLDSLFGDEYSEKTPEYYMFQEDEDKFTNAVNDAEKYKKVYGQDDEWYSQLPTEMELLSIIDSQLAEAKIYPSFYIYNRISNNYQTLALEYHYQNANQKTIKYYYLLSIKYDIESIKSSADKNEFFIALDRIRTRYEDILYCCGDDIDNDYFNDLLERFTF